MALKLDYFTIARDHRFEDNLKRPTMAGTQKGRYTKRRIKELIKKYEILELERRIKILDD